MSLANDQITAKNFKEFFEQIRPYLNGNFPIPIANQFDKTNMYSEDETIVGRWVDGKPIYQKTVNITYPNGNASIDVGLSNVENVISIHGTAINSDNNVNILSPGYSNDVIFFSLDDQELRIEDIPNYLKGSNAYITLKYTKTTDSAVAIGSDTDYSETEKIIGTWIDGKPLYQKTVNFGALPNNTTRSVVHGISNLDVAYYINVIVINGNEAHQSEIFPAINTNSDFAVRCIVNNTNISIKTITNWSDFYCYVTIQYTKTTD